MSRSDAPFNVRPTDRTGKRSPSPSAGRIESTEENASSRTRSEQTEVSSNGTGKPVKLIPTAERLDSAARGPFSRILGTILSVSSRLLDSTTISEGCSVLLPRAYIDNPMPIQLVTSGLMILVFGYAAAPYTIENNLRPDSRAFYRGSAEPG